jgi:hypothetical protein
MADEHWMKNLKVVAKLEQKMAKKNAEREERERLAASGPSWSAAGSGSKADDKKYTKKITATRDRRDDFKKAKAAAEEAEAGPAEQQLDVQKDDGSRVAYAHVAEDIQIFLQEHGSEATLDEVRRGVGVDLQQQQGLLLDALRCNPRIEAIGLASGELLKYRPPFGVRNRGALSHLLSRTMPGGGETESVLRSELKADETYPGVDADIDELLAQGKCVRVFVTHKKTRDFALFANPPGRAATEEMCNLWREEKIPLELEKELLSRKLRTQEEFDARRERVAARRKREEELNDGNKKRRTGQIRKISETNAHLNDQNATRLFGADAASKR